MTTAISTWPDLSAPGLAPTAAYVHRLAQIAGKHTLFAPFEPNWGAITLRVTPRGFATPTIRHEGVSYELAIDLLDDRFVIESSNGIATLMLHAGSIADFYRDFALEAARLGLPALRTIDETEIAGGVPFDADVEIRAYDTAAARTIWTAFAEASAALTEWQASFAGQRPPVGVMWGGFDLSAARYRGEPKTPPLGRPTFQRNGMTQDAVVVGFDLGGHAAAAGFYGYISPPPPNFASADFRVPGAAYVPSAGLVALPWAAVRESRDPRGAVIAFADAVYAAAVAQSGWPADSRERREGWHASRYLIVGA